MAHMDQITPMEAGVAPQEIERFLDLLAAKQVHLHNFMMLKGDKIFARGSYAPCKEEDIHTLFSLSKSFTSTAIGFAVQEGLLAVTDRIVDFFQEELAALPADAVCENMKKVTVRHLLTMNTGQEKAVLDPLFSDRSVDLCMAFLTSPVEREPGSWFVYNTGATYMLSVILQKISGERLDDYLRVRLFEPLGFSKQLWWECSAQGYCTGGFGLNLSVRDISKFGIFVQQKGVYEGKRLLNAAWFEEAQQPWSDCSNTWEGDNKYGYGYQFWRSHVPGSFRGDGAFGQYCLLLPHEDMIFVTTAGELDMQCIADCYWESVYASVAGKADRLAEIRGRKAEGEEALLARTYEAADEQSAWEHLKERLDSLTLATYYEDHGILSDVLELPQEIIGKTYLLPQNPLQITSLRFLPGKEPDQLCLELTNGKETDQLCISARTWMINRIHLDRDVVDPSVVCFRTGLYDPAYAKGATQDGTLYMDLFFPETAFQDSWKISFAKEKLTLTVKRNVCFVPTDFTAEAKML